MIGSRTSFLVVPVILLIALAGCAASDSSTAEEGESATSVVPSTATAAPTTTTGPVTSAAPSTTTPGDDPTTSPVLVELRENLGINALILETTNESGSHPTLSWQPADGAESYWLTVRAADARPYWAWTGADTSVRVGGGDRPDTNQTAVLHETMTWRVAAFDADGVLIAISDEASISP